MKFKSNLFLLFLMNLLWAPQASASVPSAYPAPPVEVKRPKVVRTNWINPMTGFFLPNECVDIESSENQLHIQVKVRFAVNDISAIPPIYVDVNFGGIYSGISGPITNADLTAVTVDTFNLYEATFAYELDLDPVCDAPEINFQSTYSLKMLDGPGNYVVYPIANYDNPGEPFDAGIFDETDPYNGYPPSYAEEKEICCSYGTIGFRSERPAEENEQETEVSHLVFPNPFSEVLNIGPLAEGYLPTLISIHSVNGEVVESINLSETNKTNIVLSTEHWTPGMYLINVVGKSRSQTIKVIKLAR